MSGRGARIAGNRRRSAGASLRLGPAGEPVGLLHVYSAVDGTPIAVVSKADDSPFTAADVSRVGDIDGNRAIGSPDVSLLRAHLSGDGPSVAEAIADVDGNGLVDSADAAALTGQAGAALDEARVANFVARLNDNLVLEGELDATPVGLLSCAVCWIRCFGFMNQAADCAAACQAQYDACGDLGPIDQQSECWDNVRRTCMPNCLAAVASAAGRCGSCVWTCAPKPGY